MTKLFFAFLVICLIAVAGVDYANQTRQAKLGLGEMSAGTYFSTITGRIDAVRQARAMAAERTALLEMAPRDLLPAPPAGWTRRDLTKEDRKLLGQRDRDDPLGGMPQDVRGDANMMTMLALDPAAMERRNNRQVWVYEKPGAMVLLRLATSNGAEPGGFGIQAAAMKMVNANIGMMTEKSGFGLVKGIPYIEVGSFLGGAGEENVAPIRLLTARMGKEVNISAEGIATDEDFHELLLSIDYDRLNRILEAPLADIGSAAKDLPLEEQRVLAERAEISNRAALFREGAMAELQLQRAGLEILLAGGKVPAEEAKAKQAELDTREAEINKRYDAMMAKAEPPKPEPVKEEAAEVLPSEDAAKPAKDNKPSIRDLGTGCQIKAGTKFCSSGG